MKRKKKERIKSDLRFRQLPDGTWEGYRVGETTQLMPQHEPTQTGFENLTILELRTYAETHNIIIPPDIKGKAAIAQYLAENVPIT